MNIMLSLGKMRNYGKLNAQIVENEMRKSTPTRDMTNFCKHILAQS